MLRTSAVYIALGLSAALLCAQVAHILGIVPIEQALFADDDLCGTGTNTYCFISIIRQH